MIIVDTSVWVAHLRARDSRLVGLLEEGQVLVHEYVIGELACGSLRRRAEFLHLLGHLPSAPTVTHVEIMGFIEIHSLMGKGLGLIDMHLLASTSLHGSARLMTYDQRLSSAAGRLGLKA